MKKLSPEKMLAAAMAFAAVKHEGQFDKGGMPYFLHVMKVMYFLKTKDFELMSAAVLHDCKEDCGVTDDDLRAIGMSERIIDTVTGMTNVEGETFEEKVARLTRTIDIVKCKLADLRHNTDVRRLKKRTPKSDAKMLEYFRLQEALEEALDELELKAYRELK